jgi:hypothetical protein
MLKDGAAEPPVVVVEVPRETAGNCPVDVAVVLFPPLRKLMPKVSIFDRSISIICTFSFTCLRCGGRTTSEFTTVFP